MQTYRELLIEIIGSGLPCCDLEEYVNRWTIWFQEADKLETLGMIDVITNPPIFPDNALYGQSGWNFEASQCLGGYGSVYPQEYLAVLERLLKCQRTRIIALNSLWEVSYVDNLPILPLLKPLADDIWQLNEEEVLALIAAIDCCAGEERLELLQQIRKKIPIEQIEVHKELDLYLKDKM